MKKRLEMKNIQYQNIIDKYVGNETHETHESQSDKSESSDLFSESLLNDGISEYSPVQKQISEEIHDKLRKPVDEEINEKYQEKFPPHIQLQSQNENNISTISSDSDTPMNNSNYMSSHKVNLNQKARSFLKKSANVIKNKYNNISDVKALEEVSKYMQKHRSDPNMKHRQPLFHIGGKILNKYVKEMSDRHPSITKNTIKEHVAKHLMKNK